MDNLKEKLKQLLAEAEAQETINDFVEEETFSEESVNESFDDLLKVLTGLREEKIEAEYKEENEVENDETDATTEENPKDENKGDGKTKDGEDHIDNEVETEEAQAGENKGANDALKEETVNAEYKEEHSEENVEKEAKTEEAQAGETKTETTPLKDGKDHINNDVETEKAQAGETRTEATPLKDGKDHIDNEVETEEAQAGENKTEQKPLKEETVNAEYKEEHSEENTEEEAKTEEAQAGETKTEATPLKAGADHIDNKVETEEAQAGENKDENTPLKDGNDHIDNEVETEEAQAGENKTEQKPLKEEEQVEDIEDLLFESLVNDIFVQKRSTESILAEFINIDPELDDQYLDMLSEEELNQLSMEIDILTLTEEELNDKLNYDILTLLYETEDFDFIDDLSNDTIDVLYEMLTDDIKLDETELLDESIRTFAHNMKDRFNIVKAKVTSKRDQDRVAELFKKRSKLETTKDKFQAKYDIKKIKRDHKAKKKELKKAGDWNDFTASELAADKRKNIKNIKTELKKHRKDHMEKAEQEGRSKQEKLTKSNIEGLKKNIEARTTASKNAKLNSAITKAGNKYDLFMKKYNKLLKEDISINEEDTSNRDMFNEDMIEDAKEVKKESVDYASLSEAILLGGEYFTTESLLTESAEDKINRLQEQVALLIAKESNDPLFEEFVENTISSNNLRNHIIQKYSEISREKTGEIIGEEVLSAEAKKDVEKVTKDVPNVKEDPKYDEAMTQARKDYMEDKKNKK